MTKRRASKTPKGRDKKKPRRSFGTKHVLASAFAPTFPQPAARTSEVVLKALKSAFKRPFAKRIVRPAPKKMNKAHAGETEQQIIAKCKKKAKAKKNPPSCAKPSGLLVGVNEVTRALEKGVVKIAVVCRDPKPGILVEHLPALCFVNGTQLVAMPGDGTDMAKVLGMKRTLAIAVRSMSDNIHLTSPLRILTEQLKKVTCDLDFPWLALRKSVAFSKPLVIPHRRKEERTVTGLPEKDAL